jgi:hypothetical protein
LLVRRERSMFRNAEKPVRELVDRAGAPAPRQPDREGVLLGLSPAGFHELAFADWGPLEDKRPIICVHGLTRQGRDFDYLETSGGPGQAGDLPRSAVSWAQRLARQSPRLHVAAILRGHECVDCVPRRQGGRLGRYVAGRSDRHHHGGVFLKHYPQARYQRYRSLRVIDGAASDRATHAIVRPETVICWHRAGFRSYWRWKSKQRCGRPAVTVEIRQLIRQMSGANPLWGAPRIHGELLKLGIDVGQTSVAKYMVRRRVPPCTKYMVRRRVPPCMAC